MIHRWWRNLHRRHIGVEIQFVVDNMVVTNSDSFALYYLSKYGGYNTDNPNREWMDIYNFTFGEHGEQRFKVQIKPITDEERDIKEGIKNNS